MEMKNIHEVIKSEDCYYCVKCGEAHGDGDNFIGKECNSTIIHCDKHVPCYKCNYMIYDDFRKNLIKKIEALIMTNETEILEVKIQDVVYSSEDKEKNRLLLSFRNSALQEVLSIIS